MKTFLHLLVIFLLPALLYGQENLVFKGQVTDAVTHEPLAESHVYVSCQHTGAVTDVNGNYYLEIPKCCMTQCLIVSYMGFEKYIIPIHEIAKSVFNIELEYGAITLAELVITPEYYQVIYSLEFEPFRPDYPGLFILNDMFFETMSNNQTEQLITMQ
jgi:hypothetical protein